MALLAPDILLVVMQYAPTGAHAATCNDYGAALDPVDGLGFFHAAGEMDAPQLWHIIQLIPQRAGFLIIAMGIFPVYLAGFYGHRAVEKNFPAIQFPFIIMHAHHIEDFLAAANGKCRDQDIPSLMTCRLNDFTYFIFCQLAVAVQTIAIGAFHQHHISLVNSSRVVQNGGVVLADVAAENELSAVPVFSQP